MMARMRQHLAKEDKGFTLIELLVVMIIIGILAAIAIPIFLNQRKKAEDAAAKADVSTIGKEMATWYVDGTGTQPTVAVATARYTLGGADIGKQSNNVALESQSGTSSTNWCIQVVNDKGDKTTTTSGGATYSAKGGLTVPGTTC